MTGILACSGSARAQSAPKVGPAPSPNWLWVSRGPGTERCPNRERLAAAVLSRLERASAPSSDEVSARVTLSIADGGKLRALVELRHRGQPIGARELASQDASCAELAQALAIVVALAIDVQLSGRGDSPANTAPRETSDKAPYVPVDEEFLPLPSAGNSELGAETGLRFGGALTVGLVPDPQAGLGVALAQRVGSVLELDLGFTAFPWSVTSLLPEQGAQIEYRAVLGHALMCLPLAGSFWARSSLCAGVSGGAVQTTSRGLDSAGPTTSPLLNGVLSTTLHVRLDQRWLAFFSVGLGIPWLRKEFVFSALDGTTPAAFRMPPQFGSFGIGLEYELGIRPGRSQSERERAIHF